MICLFIVESSIEIVPEEIRDERCIFNDAKRRGRRPGEILLNVSKHYTAVKKLKVKEKRGRPDIAHFTLLTALDMPLNRMGELKIYVHTVNAEIFSVNPEVRLPRNFDRFEGLMINLLRDGHVPRDPPYLLEVIDEELATLIDNLKMERVVALSSKGKPVDLKRYLTSMGSSLSKSVVGFLLGGFNRGFFSSEIASLAMETISISSYELSTHVTICKLLHEIEKTFHS